MIKHIAIAVLASLAAGCTSGRHHVVAATGTSIGVEIAQNPSTQLYQAKLGYHRAELAIVPSNRGSGAKGDKSYGGGASDTTDVVMELNYANIFSLKRSGIYQRLAVGKTAVSQPGAALMFAKDRDGNLDPGVAAEALKHIPTANVDVSAIKSPLAVDYYRSQDKERFNAAAKAEGYTDFSEFLLDDSATAEKVEAVKKGLEQ